MTTRAALADFGAFYERTYGMAYRTAYAVIGEAALAADVVQDAYLSAFRERDRFRGEAAPESWLIRIVVNAAISATRRRRVRWVEPLPSSLEDPRNDPGSAAERLSVITALQALPAQERAAVVLRYYHDYDYATIARCLHTTTGTVGSWLSRAKARLRADIEAAAAIERTSDAVEGRDDA